MLEADSPAGAYKELGYENAAGKANFGFVYKYKKEGVQRGLFFL